MKQARVLERIEDGGNLGGEIAGGEIAGTREYEATIMKGF